MRFLLAVSTVIITYLPIGLLPVIVILEFLGNNHLGYEMTMLILSIFNGVILSFIWSEFLTKIGYYDFVATYVSK